MNKKSIGLLLLGLIIVSLVAAQCGGPATQPPPTKAPEPTKAEAAPPTEEKPLAAEAMEWPLSKGARLCHLIQLGHPYSTANVDLARKEAELMGFQYDVFDMKGDIPTEISQMEDCIAKQYDAIILVPYDPAALGPPTKKAFEAGIPVVNGNMQLVPEYFQYAETYIVSSGEAEGQAAGELICQAFGGEAGNWVMIEGAPGNALVDGRGNEAVRIVEEKCPNAKVLGRETGMWDRAKSRTVMENFMTAFPDQIDLVYCHDGNECFGALEAVKEADLVGKIKIVAINGNKEEYDAIRAGEFFGTVLNDASWIAVNEVQRARDVLENRPVLREYVSPALGITIENVDEFTPFW